MFRGASLRPRSLGTCGPGAETSTCASPEACSVVTGPSSRQGECGKLRSLWDSSPRSGTKDGGVGAGHGGAVLGVQLQQNLVLSLKGYGESRRRVSPEPSTFSKRCGALLRAASALRTGDKVEPHRPSPPAVAPGLAGRGRWCRDEWLRRRALVFPTELPRGCWAGQGVLGWRVLVCSFREGGGRGRSPEEVTLG